METKDTILSVLTRQRQRYEEQMKTLYAFTNLYQNRTGINPITGQKIVALQTISDREISVVSKSASNSYVYPLTWFERQVLECMDPNSGSVSTVEGANRLMQLMKSTNTIGERYLLIECVRNITNRHALDYCYLKGLQPTLLRYMEDNHDIVTNYDYIMNLLHMLSTIELPNSNRTPLDSPQLIYFLHCGDPDIETEARNVLEHWSL